MPGPSIEVLLGEIKGEMKALREIQNVQNESIISRMDEHEKRLDERLTKVEEAFREANAREHRMNGAMWMLSVIGGGVLAFLSSVGYAAIHGVPQWVKRVFDGALTG